MGTRGKAPDALRASALQSLDKEVHSLEQVAQDLIKLLALGVQRLRAQMFEGLNYKGDHLDPTDARMLKELTAAFNSATDAQVRLDKTAEIRKNALSEEEKRAKLAEWVLSWPGTKERADWIRALARRHDEIRQGNTNEMNSLEQGPTLRGVRRDSNDDESN